MCLTAEGYEEVERPGPAIVPLQVQADETAPFGTEWNYEFVLGELRQANRRSYCVRA